MDDDTILWSVLKKCVRSDTRDTQEKEREANYKISFCMTDDRGTNLALKLPKKDWHQMTIR